MSSSKTLTSWHKQFRIAQMSKSMHHLLKRRFHLDAKSNMQRCTKYCSTGGTHHQQAGYGQQEGYHQQVETSYLHVYNIGIQCIYSHPRYDIILSLIHDTLTGWTLQLAKVFRVRAYSDNKDKDQDKDKDKDNSWGGQDKRVC